MASPSVSSFLGNHLRRALPLGNHQKACFLQSPEERFPSLGNGSLSQVLNNISTRGVSDRFHIVGRWQEDSQSDRSLLYVPRVAVTVEEQSNAAESKVKRWHQGRERCWLGTPSLPAPQFVGRLRVTHWIPQAASHPRMCLLVL